MKCFEELTLRGMIKQVSHNELEKKLNEESLTFYVGFDPTNTSLHIGSLLPLMVARKLKEWGHKPILIAGGATGKIGDPSFKKQERPLLSDEILDSNLKGISLSLRKILPEVEVVNNFDWFKNVNFLDFLRDIGKHISVAEMINKESVKSRLSNEGISFTEFCYMLLQAEDFRHLFKQKNCILQVGGSDQWGNMTMGIELIRKKEGKESFGLTHPLVTKADGNKFGKSESGTIWLNEDKTSAFDLFQFLLKTDDRDVIQFLKWLSPLSLEEISKLESSHVNNPALREAHFALAESVCSLVHGKEKTQDAINQTKALFESKDITMAKVDKEINKSSLENKKLVDALVEWGICKSKNQARTDISSGAIRLNGTKITDIQKILSTADFDNHRLVVSRGKKPIVLEIKE